MMDAIVGAVGGVKGAMDIAKGLQAALSKADLLEVRIGLMERLSEAQIAIAQAAEDLQACRERVRALEAENTQLKTFDADVENYELKDTGRGAMAYIAKDAPEEPKYGHWLCPNCFSNRKKSLMIPEDRGAYGMLHCHPCGLDLHVFGHLPREAPKGRR